MHPLDQRGAMVLAGLAELVYVHRVAKLDGAAVAFLALNGAVRTRQRILVVLEEQHLLLLVLE